MTDGDLRLRGRTAGGPSQRVATKIGLELEETSTVFGREQLIDAARLGP
jgi:hypothetical protein